MPIEVWCEYIVITVNELNIFPKTLGKRKHYPRRVAGDQEVEKGTEIGVQLRIYDEEVNGIRKD